MSTLSGLFVFSALPVCEAELSMRGLRELGGLQPQNWFFCSVCVRVCVCVHGL